MSKRLLWLIRHGESEGNLERRIQGWLDYPLTTRGRRQAARLAERLATEQAIGSIVASPLGRAGSTAEILGAVLGLPVRHDARLREYGFGPLSGQTREEIAERHPRVWEAWEDNETWDPLPGEEGQLAFRARVNEAVDDIVAGVPGGGSVAVVSHGGTINAMLSTWLGIAGRGWLTFALDNASLSLVELKLSAGGTGAAANVRLLELNDVAHLGGDLRGQRPSWFSAPWQAT